MSTNIEGNKHKSVGGELTQEEFEAMDAHSLASGTSFPVSPGEGDLFYRTDEHNLYIFNGSMWQGLNTGLANGAFSHRWMLAVEFTTTSGSYKYADLNYKRDRLEIDFDKLPNITKAKWYAQIKGGGTGDYGYARLYNETDDEEVSGSEMNQHSSYNTGYKDADITTYLQGLSGEKTFRIQIRLESGNGGEAGIRAAYIIIYFGA